MTTVSIQEMSNIVLVCLTAILVGVTAWYAVTTERILRANKSVVSVMERQLVSATRPYVSFILDILDVPNVFAVLKNTGASSAHNVVVELIPPLLKPTLDRNSSETIPARLTSNRIRFLSPGRELSELVCGWETLQKTNPPLVFAGKLAYQDEAGNIYREEFNIDLSFRKGFELFNDSTIQRRLRGIETAIRETSEQNKS